MRSPSPFSQPLARGAKNTTGAGFPVIGLALACVFPGAASLCPARSAHACATAHPDLPPRKRSPSFLSVLVVTSSAVTPLFFCSASPTWTDRLTPCRLVRAWPYAAQFCLCVRVLSGNISYIIVFAAKGSVFLYHVYIKKTRKKIIAVSKTKMEGKKKKKRTEEKTPCPCCFFEFLFHTKKSDVWQA